MNLTLLIPDSFVHFYNIHPMFVHAPLAFFPGALLLFGLALGLRRNWVLVGARVCLILGAVGAVFAFTTGLLAEGSIPHNETIHSMMQTHKFAALVVLFGAVAIAIWSGWIKWERVVAKRFFFGVLVLLNLALILVGDLGARMVYLEGAGVKTAAAGLSETHNPNPVTADDHNVTSHDHAH